MHVPDLTPVVAAGIDWLEGLVPLLFVLFWIVSQVVSFIRSVAGDGGRPGPAPVVPRRPPPVADDAREALERQIGEFLKQSRGDRDRGPAAPAAPRPEARRPRPPKPVQRPAAPRAASRVPPPLPTASPRLSDRHLQPLGDAGDDIAEHVEGAFAHDLSHRVSSSAAAATGRATPTGTTAADLAAALRDPATLRRLVLVREVLERPTDRWE